MDAPLFQPTPSDIEHCQLTQFARKLEQTTQQTLSHYRQLHQFSVDNLEVFWRAVWEYGGVAGEPGEVVLENSSMPGAVWFPQARLNFAENLLAHGAADQTAIIAVSESRDPEHISYSALRKKALALASYLHNECHIKPGDRVAAYLGNTPEAIIAMLATTYLGAIWSSASPDFGYEGTVDRFGQIEPKVLIAGNAYCYGGKTFERQDNVLKLRGAIPSIKHVINVQCVASCSAINDAIEFEDIVNSEPPEPPYQRFPFNHPLYILFSSGTTGKPKCIVHSAGGTLLQHIKELRLHGDISADSRFFYFTTTGWMMWNWLASGLVTGATLVLFDGNPMHPTPEVLWQMAAGYGVTHFGASAKYYAACRKQNLSPKHLEISKLRVMFSTGSPLAPEDFDWAYDQVKREVMLHSISGGTDIVSCFVGGNPWLPVMRGKIQHANLGMAVEAWNEAGKAIINERGELVCTRPAPCMPIGFWNDTDHQRYRSAYFERFPGVWAHGDFCMIDELGQVVILGRSDTTLNPGGVRIGTAEIYRQVETLDQVQDSLVVGRPIDGDIEVILFVKLVQGENFNSNLEALIKSRIRQNTTPRHVPARIAAVPDIPYTRSGKKVELAVTEILRGDTPNNVTALANPEALEFFSEYVKSLHLT